MQSPKILEPTVQEVQWIIASSKQFKDSPAVFLQRIKMTKELQNTFVRFRRKKKNNYFMFSSSQKKPQHLQNSYEQSYAQLFKKKKTEQYFQKDGVKVNSEWKQVKRPMNLFKIKQVKKNRTLLRNEVKSLLKQQQEWASSKIVRNFQSLKRNISSINESTFKDLSDDFKIELQGCRINYKDHFSVEKFDLSQYTQPKIIHPSKHRKLRNTFNIEAWKNNQPETLTNCDLL